VRNGSEKIPEAKKESRQGSDKRLRQERMREKNGECYMHALPQHMMQEQEEETTSEKKDS
jgi:hypothetical protein